MARLYYLTESITRILTAAFIAAAPALSMHAAEAAIRADSHLINEQSPYLRQHADNLVDWYPWAEEAFQLARNENKPIFLT